MSSRRWLVSLICWVLGFIAVEAGLSLHALLDRYESQIRPTQAGRTRVLLVGDSVLDGPHSVIPKLLSVELDKRRPNFYEVAATTQGGLASRDVEESIQRTLDEHHPQLTVLLVGRSDLINTHHPDASPSRLLAAYDRLSHLRSIRLFWLIFDELQAGWRLAARAVESRWPAAQPSALQVLETLKHFQALVDYNGMWNYLERLPFATGTDDSFLDLADVCAIQRYKLEAAMYLRRNDVATILDTAVNCAYEAEKRQLPISDRFYISLWLGATLRESSRRDLADYFLHRAIELNPQHPIPYSILGWMASAEDNCRGTISYFERALRLDPEDRRVLTRLQVCYQTEKATEAGRSYFQTLLPLASDTKNLIRLFIANNSAPTKSEDFTNSAPTTQSFYESRDAYISALWLNRKLGKQDEVNRLFREWPSYAAAPDTELDEKSYQQIVSRVLAGGSQLLALQYPPDPDWPVLHALRSFDHGVEFLSMRSILSAAIDQYSISDDVEEDFVHLTPIGAQVFASGLADKVVAMSAAVKF